ncbi:MAG: arsenite methyltransferase [Bacteroidetes bacterium]|nr:arsenite methyltransferase [Bacteroidota bacterium]MBU1422515.1 arsenite methyltransferase [Bacteroidota bacterium]
MDTNNKIKENVKQKYGQIAKGELKLEIALSSCCCSAGTGTRVVVDMSAKYSDNDKAAIPEGADLGLGCGTPAAFADLEEGMAVLDLGSGAGIDCFVASKYVGSSGKVIGVDMTEEMIRKANENKLKVNASNVEFRYGEIEALPVDNDSVDRVISNCVINLVPDKKKAFSEIFRVLKPDGKFTVSDIVVDGAISEKERTDAALWAGCISGALSREEYIGIIENVGFKNITILSEKKYDYTLESGGGLYSITVSGLK